VREPASSFDHIQPARLVCNLQLSKAPEPGTMRLPGLMLTGGVTSTLQKPNKSTSDVEKQHAANDGEKSDDDSDAEALMHARASGKLPTGSCCFQRRMHLFLHPVCLIQAFPVFFEIPK